MGSSFVELDESCFCSWMYNRDTVYSMLHVFDHLGSFSPFEKLLSITCGLNCVCVCVCVCVCYEDLVFFKNMFLYSIPLLHSKSYGEKNI